MSSSSLTARLARNSSSSAAETSSLAAKKASWAVRKRSQRASSSAREARPAARQRSISCLKARAVGVQSVLVESSSASATSSSLVARASARLVSRSANQARRALSKELRAWLKRCHRADSVALSSLAPERWCCFHWSSRARIRSPLVFHCVEAGRLAGDLLGLGDDGLALRGGLGPGRGALLGLVGPLGLQAGLDPLDGGVQGRDVADDPGGLDVLLEGGQAVGDLLGGDVGVGQPGLEQVGRRRELVVLAGEVLQGLVGRGARGRSRPRAPRHRR